MRSISMNCPMLTLPQDSLSEIALRLPSVKSTKPWRDVNSLATTCKGLYYWKKSKVDMDVQSEWNDVNELVPGKNSWIEALEVIASENEHSPTRLFREPILRRLASKRLDSDLDNQIKDFDLFVTMLYSMLEIISYDDIRQLLDVLNKASLHTKTQIVSLLPAFLPELESKNRQQVLCQLFKLVDSDPDLRHLLITRGEFNKIGNALGEDHQSKILLILGLYSRKLFSLRSDDADDLSDSDNSGYADKYDYPGYSDENGIELSFISDDVRWPWVLDKVPEYLDTAHGVHTMLDDPSCRKQMINYLNKSFSECKSDIERFSVCEKVSAFYSKLSKCRDGKKLIDELMDWFLASPDFIVAENGILHSRFIGLLSKHIAMYKTLLGIREKSLLTEKLSKVIGYAIQVNAFDQSASLLNEMVKTHKKLITKVCEGSFDLTNKNTLMDALLHVNNLKTLDARYHYVSALCIAARHHRDSDPKFFKAFFDVRNAILMKM